MDELSGKVAVVTGGASGIGLALATAFAAEGMRIVLADVERDRLDEAAAGLVATGAEVLAVRCDVSDAASVDALRDRCVEAFGTAHVVCNNAGVGGGGLSWEIPLETWRWLVGVNLMGVVHGLRSFVPLLLAQGEGHVVNTASAAGLTAAPFLSPYSATKHAVVSLTEALSMELDMSSGGAVKASVLCPMWVRTRIADSGRNAPEEVTAAAGQSLGGEQVSSMIAGLVAGGLDPAVVAGEVVTAVREGRFWVLPHPEVAGYAVERAARIGRGERPAMHLPSEAG